MKVKVEFTFEKDIFRTVFVYFEFKHITALYQNSLFLGP